MSPNTAQVLVALSVLWSLGCASDKSHPPPCTDVGCYATLPTTIDISSGGADSTDNSTNVAGTGTTASISGQIVEVEDSTFAISAGSLSTSSFIVQAPTAGGTVFESTVGSTFSLDGVVHSKAAWLVARPAASSDLMPGVVGFDSTTQASVVVPMVRKTSLEIVASSLTTMATIDTAAAQVVLRFVNPSGKGVPGVKVAITGAAVVAYDYLGGYSNDTASTSSSGLAFLFNVPAASVPQATTLTLSGVVSAQYSVLVLEGGATIGEVVVSAN